MLRLKLNHVSKRSYWSPTLQQQQQHVRQEIIFNEEFEKVKAEICHYGMISASWTDKHISVIYVKHISVIYVYFLIITGILGISTPLHHRENTV